MGDNGLQLGVRMPIAQAASIPTEWLESVLEAHSGDLCSVRELLRSPNLSGWG